MKRSTEVDNSAIATRSNISSIANGTPHTWANVRFECIAAHFLPFHWHTDYGRGGKTGQRLKMDRLRGVVSKGLVKTERVSGSKEGRNTVGFQEGKTREKE